MVGRDSSVGGLAGATKRAPRNARRDTRARDGERVGARGDSRARAVRWEKIMTLDGRPRARAPGVAGEDWDAYASVELVRDARAAGESWRAEMFREFRWRVRAAGLESDPECARALREMAALTRELSEMNAAQTRADAPEAPWWRDGEYDETRAEEANDRGMARMKSRNYEAAFDAFTEAIRLEPRKAVYHANRAAAGLKLERFRVAADDAACAVERDATYVKAILRGATAQLKLRCPEKALEMFDAVLKIDPEDETATTGRREAARALASANAEAERQRDAALHGSRSPLPRQDIDPDVAAESLLSAEELVRANPNLEGAKANLAEALVCCQRYEAAIEQCKSLLEESLDRKYLIAETRWRMGDVDGALAEISSASFRDSYDKLSCKKCVELGARLLHMQDLIKRAERDAEDDQFSSAIRMFDKILQAPEGRMKTRFRGRILRARADCHFRRHQYEAHDDPIVSQVLSAATQDLGECLSLDGRDYQAYVLRAAIRAARGDHQGAFVDLRSAQTIAPTLNGIDDMVRKASIRALRSARNDTTMTDAPSGARCGKFYDVLGIKPDADLRAVKSAYRKLAAVWHPDKWTRAAPEEAAKAENRFKIVQRAYATLSDAKQRKMYDLDPGRFDDASAEP